MMTRSEVSPSRSAVPRDRYLWLLAAILGVATVHAITSVVHDTSQRRAAAMLVARSVAEQIVAAASARLEAATLVALAPALRMTAEDAPRGHGGRLVAELGREQLIALGCRCREIVPAVAFFRFDVSDGALEIAPIGDSSRIPTGDLPSALTNAAKAHAIQSSGAGRTRLWMDDEVDDLAIVSALSRDGEGRPASVAGLVGERGALIGWAFAGAVPSFGNRGASPEGTLATPDSMSLVVRDPEGRTVFGALDSARRFRAVVTPDGPLAGLTVEVALAGRQIATPLIAPIASRQMWHLMALLLATVLVIVFAVRSSRRETQLARARSDFVAAVSHELRMPLAQILLAGETLTMQRERDATQRMTLSSSIVREARRLIALVENVLLFSRAGAVELRPTLRPVAVEKLFEDVIESVALAAEEVDQTIVPTVPAQLMVTGDQALLRQALVNLVDNAMKYGTAGQRIRLIAERSASDRVVLVVEDQGRGVPHAERVRVFEPYERLDRDQGSERTGTGLGLAVVREVVEACKGRVWLEETSGGGARAVIELAAATPIGDTRPAVVV